MRSSLINHVCLDIPSAILALGFPIHTARKHLSLHEINELQKTKLYKLHYNTGWFETAAADKEPISAYTTEQLVVFLGINDELCINMFVSNLPKNLNLGGILEALRIINYNFSNITGDFPVFLDRLSEVGFFKLQ